VTRSLSEKERGLVTRSLAAAQELERVAAVERSPSEEKGLLPPPPPVPPQDAASSMAAVQTLTLQALEKMGSLEADVGNILRPPPRKRKVYGGAQAIQPGSRPAAAAQPARVYNVHSPSARRIAAMQSLSNTTASVVDADEASPAEKHGAGVRAAHPVPCDRARPAAVLIPPLELLLHAPPPEGDSLGSNARSDGGQQDGDQQESEFLRSYIGRQAPTVIIRDGLTPGQRAFGAKGRDRYASCRASVFKSGRPAMAPHQTPNRVSGYVNTPSKRCANAHRHAPIESTRRTQRTLRQRESEAIVICFPDQRPTLSPLCAVPVSPSQCLRQWMQSVGTHGRKDCLLAMAAPLRTPRQGRRFERPQPTAIAPPTRLLAGMGV
jgi:hypothetical protein